jgi:hypothetical protein
MGKSQTMCSMVKIMPMVMLVATQNTEDPDDGAGDDDADGGKSDKYADDASLHDRRTTAKHALMLLLLLACVC